MTMEPPGRQGSINSPSSASPGKKIHMQSLAESLRGRASGGGRLGKVRATWSSLMKGTVFSSIFTLLTTCIGAGTLSLPFAFNKGGLITASIIFFLIMVVSVIVGFLLFSAKHYSRELYPEMAIWGYEDLAFAAFGPVGKIIVLITLIILLFLSLIAYMIYTRDQLDLIVQFALSRTGHTPACSPLVNCAVLMSIAFIPIFPITLLRDLTPMQITSTFSILCIGYVGVTMFIRTIHNNWDLQHHVNLVPQGFKGVLVTVTYCSLSFVCHFNLLPLQKELRRPTRMRMNIIVVGSMLLAYTLYNLVIFSGFFTFYDLLKEDVMLNYPRTDILMTTARVALFFTLLFSYPVLLHPTRAAINRLLVYVYNLTVGRSVRSVVGREVNCEGEGVKGVEREVNCEGEGVGSVEGDKVNGEEDTDNDVKGGEGTPLLPKTPSTASDTKIPLPIWISETWMLFATTFICASFIPNVGLVWNFVGSIGGTLVLYIFPPAFYLRLRYMHRRRLRDVSLWSQYTWYDAVYEAVATVIMVTGCLLLVAENYSSVEAILTQPHIPSSLCYQAKCGSLANWTNGSSSTYSSPFSQFDW